MGDHAMKLRIQFRSKARSETLEAHARERTRNVLGPVAGIREVTVRVRDTSCTVWVVGASGVWFVAGEADDAQGAVDRALDGCARALRDHTCAAAEPLSQVA